MNVVVVCREGGGQGEGETRAQTVVCIDLLRKFYLLFCSTFNSALNMQVDSVQALGGTGALRVGLDFLRSRLGCDTVYVSTPTWGTDGRTRLYITCC